MTEDEKMLWMFRETYGEMTGACSSQVLYSDYTGEPEAVACMKYENICWSKNKTELMFDGIAALPGWIISLPAHSTKSM